MAVPDNYGLRRNPAILSLLLKDMTKSASVSHGRNKYDVPSSDSSCNIFWATSDYEYLGSGFSYSDLITPQCFKDEHESLIRPRVLKTKDEQNARIRDKAEVFTPTWMCNEQNNLIDEQWFGRKNVFNQEIKHLVTAANASDVDGARTSENLTYSKSNEGNLEENKTFLSLGWQTNHEPIAFPNGKTWRDYVREQRLEITCGEAPYLASRYDTTTGAFIPVTDRIGLLDRKLRVVGENTTDPKEWFEATKDAFKSVYAYEWHGDSLFLARESLLCSFVDYCLDKFGQQPDLEQILDIGLIIAWNVWQMDGLKGVIPNSCQLTMPAIQCNFLNLIEDDDNQQQSLNKEFTDADYVYCDGCRTDNIHAHNGTYCLVRDWFSKKKVDVLRFVDLF